MLGFAATLLLSAACTTSSPESATPAPDTPGTPSLGGRTQYPVQVDNCGQTLTIERKPERAVFGYGGLGDAMLELGLGEQIIGSLYRYDRFSALVNDEHQRELAAIRVLGNGDLPPSKEILLAERPDFVYACGANLQGKDGTASRADLEAAGIPVFEHSWECGRPEDQGVATALDEIRNLGIIFDVQDRAAEVIAAIEEQLADVDRAVAGRSAPKTLLWDSYQEEVALYPCCLFHDVARHAGGDTLFRELTYTYEVTISQEAIAVSPAEVVVGIEYDQGAEQYLDDLTRVIANTPAGRNNRIGLIPNYFANPARVGEHVQAMARVIHPEAFPAGDR